MSDYQYRTFEDSDRLRLCEGCNAAAPVRLFSEPSLLTKYHPEPFYLCELCAHTEAGNAVTYPDQYKDRHMLRHVCHVGNLVIDACTGRRKKLESKEVASE